MNFLQLNLPWDPTPNVSQQEYTLFKYPSNNDCSLLCSYTAFFSWQAYLTATSHYTSFIATPKVRYCNRWFQMRISAWPTNKSNIYKFSMWQDQVPSVLISIASWKSLEISQPMIGHFCLSIRLEMITTRLKIAQARVTNSIQIQLP